MAGSRKLELRGGGHLLGVGRGLGGGFRCRRGVPGAVDGELDGVGGAREDPFLGSFCQIADRDQTGDLGFGLQEAVAEDAVFSIFVNGKMRFWGFEVSSWKSIELDLQTRQGIGTLVKTDFPPRAAKTWTAPRRPVRRGVEASGATR